MDAAQTDFYARLAHAIAVQFGSNCEVVVHDLETNDPERSIVAIENGHVTGRSVGDGPSHIVLDAVKAGKVHKLSDRLAYLTKTTDGRILRSSTVFIRNVDNVPVGILGINYDITVLAAAADTGTQAAMMAPTSVLAAQYAQKLGPLLDAAGVTWCLLTGSTPPDERSRAHEGIATGAISVTFGTTALISDAVSFSDLTLVVIDEQHRFGVDQRAALRRKGPGADMLAMTATPIPRTLALSVYGDVSLSQIRHRPRSGAGVSTKVVTPDNLDLAWGAVRDAVAAGQQAYVICPLVDDADDGSELEDVPEQATCAAKFLHSATHTAETLAASVLPGLAVGLLHGRMGAGEKDEAMAAFREGATDVLVSTTVVEVGVDVPNATVMVVLDADRFGLATLHQLRGRVGRGDLAGTVFLSAAAKRGSVARRRLQALEATSDGFELAELDLKLRHEGDVLGLRQHGGVTLRLVDLACDADLVEWAHEDARALAEADPALTRAQDRPLALEARDRFREYFEELERA